MNNKIHTCLWFNGQGKAAAEFYCSIFPNSQITTDTPMVVNFEIEGKNVMTLNGGEQYKMNPAVSFYVSCESVEQIDNYYSRLIDGGTALMPLDKYAWSERYGWVNDKFGTSWQLILDTSGNIKQKIATALLFTGSQYGKAAEAMDHYTSVFPGSKIHTKQLYPAGDPAMEGKLLYGEFSLSNELFIAMDGPGEHAFQFDPGNSIVVECDRQDEIDHYWEKLTAGGKEVQCGWLEDKFSVSWQIIPAITGRLLSDPERRKRVMEVVQKSIKLNIQEMQDA
jgi:predicted 3-demethylubiquinone-9 3-methyltransferase (glyoxalase superfamily)